MKLGMIHQPEEMDFKTERLIFLGYKLQPKTHGVRELTLAQSSYLNIVRLFHLEIIPQS